MDPNMFTCPGEAMVTDRWNSFIIKNKNIKIPAASLPPALRGKGMKWREVQAFYEAIDSHRKNPWYSAVAAAAEAHGQHEELAEQWAAVSPSYPKGTKTSAAERSIVGVRKPGETPKAVLTRWE